MVTSFNTMPVPAAGAPIIGKPMRTAIIHGLLYRL